MTRRRSVAIRRLGDRKLREGLELAGLVILMLLMPLFQIGLAVILRWISARLAG